MWAEVSFRGYTSCILNMLTYINNKERRQPPASVPRRARPSWPSSYFLSSTQQLSSYQSSWLLSLRLHPTYSFNTAVNPQFTSAVPYISTVCSCMLPLNLPYSRTRSLSPSPSPYDTQRSPRSCVVTTQVLAHTICAIRWPLIAGRRPN